MNDVVEYSRKLKEKENKFKKILIIVCVISAIFSFSIGFYLSYVVNHKEANKNRTKFDEIYNILANEWYYGKEDNDIENTLLDRAIYGMIDENKDPFTRYLTSLGSLATSYEGLGITITQYKDYFMITEVVNKVNMDEYVGIKVGDILKSIDGNSLQNKDNDYIKTLIANKESVTMVVERNGVDLTITGYITTYSPVTVFKDFSYSNELAYIRIDQFGLDTAEVLEEYLEDAKDLGYNKLILDLRDNPGGYITSVVDCADLFLEKGKVVLTTKDKEDNAYSYKTNDNDKYDFNKIVILIDQNSASGAEALSAALNENIDDIVELVGVTTYGKGSAQKTVYFSDGTYFHYTYALWFTPGDNSINKVGVSPEIAYEGSGLHLLSFNGLKLKENDYGQEVKNLQLILKELGYYDGEITGFFSETVKQSLINYQNYLGISPSGELDALTIRYILAKIYDDKVLDYKNEVISVINRHSA